MRLNSFIHKIKYKFYRCDNFEKKLIKYQGYRLGSIIKWKIQTFLKWRTIKKILIEFKIYDGSQIRENLRSLVEKNSSLFDQANCYVTNFGGTGKSGNVVLYEFSHAMPHLKGKIIDSWKIPELPPNSIIVFVDDLIGTGRQSFRYITEKLNSILNPSHNPYLLCLCATSAGINKVEENTNFNIISADTPQNFFASTSGVFKENEKVQLQKLNDCLTPVKSTDYNRGLLIAFYYAVPNNTMPIIWKDKFKYINEKDKQREWFALLPRIY